jgi:hypothetical protein
MNRYRVHFVSKPGRFAPLLTVLVEADSAVQALEIAQVRCAGKKVVSAEDVTNRNSAPLRLTKAADSPAPASAVRLWDPVALVGAAVR